MGEVVRLGIYFRNKSAKIRWPNEKSQRKRCIKSDCCGKHLFQSYACACVCVCVSRIMCVMGSLEKVITKIFKKGTARSKKFFRS